MPDLRVLVIASNPLARAGLSALLADQPGLNIVGQAEHDVLDTLDIYRPDVTLWDMGWEPLTYLDRLRDLRDARQPIVALLANVTNAIEATAALLSAGVRGLLLQNSNGDVLAAALNAVTRGMTVIASAIADSALVDTLRLSAGNDRAAPDALTPRELEVINLIAEGLPNKIIANQLNISEHTVKFHVNAILTKLGAQSRTEAVVRATRLGYITL
ncbi:MAG: response regulator transcription factor [Anaerolineae bacterium]|uniref:response regulator transcription factor n=1 Tax=Candidatus Flexifilum breve TaxID=3140694 RepID=UPI001AC21281|nr:response regulator transcription factor [Chloroflexota bacterium]MBK9748777.1 response regulator transcription factor [Chloroflexota bacterium]MBN8634611.1 response regulator transcription factor [Anaerolineae bacterium]